MAKKNSTKKQKHTKAAAMLHNFFGSAKSKITGLFGSKKGK